MFDLFIQLLEARFWMVSMNTEVYAALVTVYGCDLLLGGSERDSVGIGRYG